MTARNEAADFDPILLAVLSRRLESIIREMSNTVMRASRSAVITNARDMSCGILTYDHRLICVEEAMPIHVSALDLTTGPITELFDDVKEESHVVSVPWKRLDVFPSFDAVRSQGRNVRTRFDPVSNFGSQNRGQGSEDIPCAASDVDD